MPEQPTIADLIKVGAVTSEAVDAAVATILADPRAGRFEIADNQHLDLTRIIRRNSVARTMKDPDASEGLKRGVLRKAILLAQPVKA